MVSTRRSGAVKQAATAEQAEPDAAPAPAPAEARGTKRRGGRTVAGAAAAADAAVAPGTADAPAGAAGDAAGAAAAADAAADAAAANTAAGPAEPQAQPPSAKRRRPSASAPPTPGAAAAGPADGAAAAAAAADGEIPEPEGLMDGFRNMPALRLAIRQLQARVDDSAVFLRPSPEVATAAREVAKLLYKMAANQLLQGGGAGAVGRAERRALRGGAGAPLPELHTDAAFDPEQIWLQMEPATEATVRRVRRLIRAAEPLAAPSGGAQLVTPEALAGVDRLIREGEEGPDGSSEEDEDEEGEEGDEEGPDGMSEGESEDEEDEGEDEDEDMEEGGGKKARKGAKAATKAKAKAKPPRGPGGGSGGVDDRFFRLTDMERYVADAERRAMGSEDEEDLLGEKGEGEDEEGEDEEDDEMLFGGGGSDDEEAALERLLDKTAAAAGKKKGGAGGLRYEDFFGEGAGEGEEDEDEEGEEGEEDDEEGGGPFGGKGVLSSDDEEGALGLGGEDEEGEEDARAARRRSGKDAGPRGEAGGKGSRGGAEARALMSTHERRLARLQERVAELESEALGNKSWHLTGEVAAGKRPVNSALELDMEFETTAKPAPVQTDEMTNDIEAIIKKRIVDRRFDDVVRVVPPPPEVRKKAIELDDTKAKSGLGELYEQDYVRQVAGGTAEDKDEKLRLEAKALFKALCGKLDALSRFHYAPKPVVEDMTVRTEVPAIVMEEAAPVAVSKAAMQTPAEVYEPAAKDGRPVAEGELTREERSARRAKKKRVRKNKEAAKESEMRARAVAAGGTADIVGRKSEAKVVASKGVKVAEGAGSKTYGRTDVGTSSAVFAKLAAEQAAAAAGGGAAKVARELKKAKGGSGEEGRKGGAAAYRL
ncbi:hypothetical protein HYH03_003752 [Edaphochlamys debaryana]|uniref:Uncharacterized protein n=1 Tax=Edaphochlamys debaryana TaxID=47281 RepID=A0A835YCV7_9CHLO|nr:hypothetical protein HYH03_003752 [Edaphochlamys debaryana]|eukprot:KAG2498501.1 hypothetical protein HYH03_003752 [Edaphochlamys debaryana]